MKVEITEYLAIDLEKEVWCCKNCQHEITAAQNNYKEGLVVYPRDPREIHQPLLNPDLYEFTYAPDPTWVQIVEFYCPSCATMMEVEYLPPGYPPTHDIEIDIASLKEKFVKKGATT